MHIISELLMLTSLLLSILVLILILIVFFFQHNTVSFCVKYLFVIFGLIPFQLSIRSPFPSRFTNTSVCPFDYFDYLDLGRLVRKY